MVGRMVYNIDTKNGLGARFLWLMTLTPKILTKAADRVLPSNNYNYWTVTHTRAITAKNGFFVHPDQHNGQNHGCGSFKP